MRDTETQADVSDDSEVVVDMEECKNDDELDGRSSLMGSAMTSFLANKM